MTAADPDAPIDPEIATRIPHRPPMLLVDQIVAETEDSIHCRKRIRGEEFFVQGHYPGQPLVPGVILCEMGAQSGALLLAKRVDAEAGVPVLTRVSDAKFKRMVRPGDQVEIQVTIDEELSGAFFMSAKLTVDEQVAVRLKFACTLAAQPE